MCIDSFMKLFDSYQFSRLNENIVTASSAHARICVLSLLGITCNRKTNRDNGHYKRRRAKEFRKRVTRNYDHYQWSVRWSED